MVFGFFEKINPRLICELGLKLEKDNLEQKKRGPWQSHSPRWDAKTKRFYLEINSGSTPA